MTKRMLIDATHAEETRVVVLDGTKLEDFDVETATKKQLKGNIYLARVVRVEPSLQAAFVEYGGGRHGFLAFGEIHPDYYQIPVADRQRLLAMQAAETREDDDEPAPRQSASAPEKQPASVEQPQVEQEPPEELIGEPAGSLDAPSPELVQPTFEAFAELPAEQPLTSEAGEPIEDRDPDGRAQSAMIPREERFGPVVEELDRPDEAAREADGIDEREMTTEDGPEPEPAPASETAAETAFLDAPGLDAPPPETVGGDPEAGEGAEDARRRRESRFLRSYRIQEVIRRRQIMLIQVVKEERGGKGAALTTYISLAGRFCVLMPNSPRGGGVSRKITSAADRKRLKEVTTELELPAGMGLIVRTAGAARPKPEIKRDAEYLMRLWDDIRELTMRSMAPALIYEEASLIKRAIRDVYSRDVDEIIVDGEAGFRAAHDFMRMLMPAHARKVQLWRGQGGQPLFAKNQVEAQLDAMLLPTVQLKSGGYLVINQTEALVAIDVNSGRATRERNVEETAVKTNLEAADEAARQLRLRDLAGLIVIDFIDMESRRHNAAVEKRLKDALKDDRARIQVGSISHFGLLEMSRQRLRPSLTESSFITCPTCGGTGHVRSVETAATHVLRAIEEEGAKAKASVIMVHASGPLVMYLLNHMRERVGEIEQRFGMRVQFAVDDGLVPPACRIDRVRLRTEGERPPIAAPLVPAAPMPLDDMADTDDLVDEEEAAEPVAAAATAAAQASRPVAGETAEEGERRRRRRRRRRGGRRENAVDANGQPIPEQASASGEDDGEDGDDTGSEMSDADDAVADEILDAGDAADLGAVVAPLPVAIDDGLIEGPAMPPMSGELSEDSAEAGEARRRRGRRGGRRRRGPAEGGDASAAPETDAEPEMVAEPPPALSPPPPPQRGYSGPTPADPFGAPDFDVFDLIERAQEAELAALVATSARASEAAAQVEPEPEQAVFEPVSIEVAPVEAEPEPAEIVPAAAEIVPEAVTEPVAEPVAAAPEAEAAPEKPVKAKAVRKPRVTKASLARAAAEAEALAAAGIDGSAPQATLDVSSPAEAATPEPVAAEPEASVQPETPAEPAAPAKKGWWRRS